jgi:hypothetical protein
MMHVLVNYIFTNDAAYFVSFYRCSIIPNQGPRPCQSWFVVASRPPLDPLVQAMTRPCHQPHPMPPNRGCPSPSCQLLPPSPHAFRLFPLHPRFMPSSCFYNLLLHVSSPFSYASYCLFTSFYISQFHQFPPFSNWTLLFIPTWIFFPIFDVDAIECPVQCTPFHFLNASNPFPGFVFGRCLHLVLFRLHLFLFLLFESYKSHNIPTIII